LLTNFLGALKRIILYEVLHKNIETFSPQAKDN